ncbi:23S rRNA pseudouridine(1911/1915/1917) synthase RluD [Aequoribacter sp.]|uniref:23S rRNA pseudouridine(1911/1915/1917) synthase RluD n=2 Tax=Aequoribacter sp. TaxID=2847771 RepID=UPI003C585F71
MKEVIQRSGMVPIELHRKRVDQVAAALWPEFSRGKLQEWIKSGALLVDGNKAKPKQSVDVDSTLTLSADVEPAVHWQPQLIPMDIVYEDEDVIVVNKPVGLVVHPAAGNWDGTLVNALLAHDASLEQVPRAGVVHRLDKDTSGLMVVAKTLQSHTALVEALQKREVSRHYIAIAHGSMTGGGVVDAPIGRHPTMRQKMAVVASGKPARTHYSLGQRFKHFTELHLKLETGRTHQIRVHMAHKKHPLVGDSVYGGRARVPGNSAPELVDAIREFPRQALHAKALAFFHPISDEWMSFDAPIPDDMKQLLETLEQYDVS